MEPGIIILAAGSSTRMGQSKQLLEINGQSLLEHAASEALRVSNMVLVVLGAQYEKHHAAIVQLPVHSVENKHWNIEEINIFIAVRTDRADSRGRIQVSEFCFRAYDSQCPDGRQHVHVHYMVREVVCRTLEPCT